MTNTPATPSELDEILRPFHQHNCHSRAMWFKGQTEPFPCDCDIQEAKAALQQLIDQRVAAAHKAALQFNYVNPSGMSKKWYEARLAELQSSVEGKPSI